MESRLNKPKVFLSHAWKNKSFIERLANDLRKCQIDYWLDSEEIRDGRSWLKMIFEDGIPTCDAVIVYLTEESLRSKMVEKELDAAFVQQLSDGGVALLPYINRDELRGRLRSDIQSLQCRTWNEDNYDSILPTVVAEIWRSYLERTIDRAVLQEKSRRLEQELENNRLKERYESSVFSAREEQEFEYLRQQLGRTVEIEFSLCSEKQGDEPQKTIGKETCRISLLSILLATIQAGGIYFDQHYVSMHVIDACGVSVDVKGNAAVRRRLGQSLDPSIAKNVLAELKTFGLVKITRVQRFDRPAIAYELSEKMYRLKYWLEYNNLLSADWLIENIVTLVQEEPPLSEQKTEAEKATEQAIAADRRISKARRRNQWRTSGEGTVVATRDVQTIFTEIEKRVAESNKILEHIKLDFERDFNSCNVANESVRMTLSWNCPTKDVQDCSLCISAYALKPRASEKLSLPRQVFGTDFDADVNSKLELFWRRKEAANRSSHSEIVELCWTKLIGLIQRDAEGTL